MNTYCSNIKRLFKKGCVALLGVLTLSLASCKENINEGNYAIKTEQTMADYLSDNPSKYSDLKAIFERVVLGDSAASPLFSVISARGNYTLFAPNNEAIEKYVTETLGLNSIDEMTYAQAELIANSCLIDNGDDDAYEEADFRTDGGTFDESNLNDRTLSCKLETEGNESYYIINGSSRVLSVNTEVSNGMVHEVNTVIAPSSDNLYELISAADNTNIFAYLMQETGWADSMNVSDRDLEYEKEDHDVTYTTNAVSGTFTVMQRRYYGFTAFVELDGVFQEKWGIPAPQLDEEGHLTNGDAILAAIQTHCEAVYGTTDRGNLKSADNAVNRFIAYHILQGKMAYDRLVRHFNEFNYKYSDAKKPQSISYPVNVWDYYTTVGSKYRSLMKITQVGDTGFEQDQDHKIYINRISEYNDGRDGDYTETGIVEGHRGACISSLNGSNDNNALNGYYFPIDDILVYDDDIRNQLSSERIRMDMTTMLPEILSNSVRNSGYCYFPTGYFDNITNESSGTVLLYLVDHSGGSWRDYQGDEILATGQYDFVLKLPPVPKTGTYELRMGVSNNTLRGMVQVYFGNDPLRLAPVGLPYDMRQSVPSVVIPWVEDEDDAETNAENDRNMRNQGYMKAPQYFCITTGKGDTPVRNLGGSEAALRKIVTVATMDADQTYYLRFKSALKKSDSQFFMDYFEYVPTTVYNGAQEEDIW
jgi:uncharacterized surface protein with fasciclin (FAS1) repeats